MYRNGVFKNYDFGTKVKTPPEQKTQKNDPYTHKHNAGFFNVIFTDFQQGKYKTGLIKKYKSEIKQYNFTKRKQ